MARKARKTKASKAQKRRVKRGSSTYRKAGTPRLVRVELTFETTLTKRELSTRANYYNVSVKGEGIGLGSVARVRFIEDLFDPAKDAKGAKS